MDFKIRPETVKLLKENMVGLSSNFLNMMPKAQATKAKINENTSN